MTLLAFDYLALALILFLRVKQSRMHLYHLSLQPPTAINQAVVGNFSGARQQEILVSRGSRLELLRVDSNGKMTTVLAQDAFGSIRSLSSFRLTGGTKGEHIGVAQSSLFLTIPQIMPF